jgi:hypothetical protein
MESLSNEIGKTVISQPLNAKATLTTGEMTEECGCGGEDVLLKPGENGRTTCSNGVCSVTWKPARHAA